MCDLERGTRGVLGWCKCIDFDLRGSIGFIDLDGLCIHGFMGYGFVDVKRKQPPQGDEENMSVYENR